MANKVEWGEPLPCDICRDQEIQYHLPLIGPHVSVFLAQNQCIALLSSWLRHLRDGGVGIINVKRGLGENLLRARFRSHGAWNLDDGTVSIQSLRPCPSSSTPDLFLFLKGQEQLRIIREQRCLPSLSPSVPAVNQQCLLL